MAKASPTPATKTVSVAFEVHELQRVVEGVAALVDAESEGDPKAERITATLGLVSCRLRDLGRVLRGALAVEEFWRPENAALVGEVRTHRHDAVLGAPRTRTASRGRI